MDKNKQTPNVAVKTEEKNIATATVTTTTAATLNPTPSKKGWSWPAFVAGMVVAIGGYYIYTAVTTPAPTQILGDTDAVATINGTAITKADFDSSMAQTGAAAAAQGFDMSSSEAQEEMQTQTLDILTNTVLLIQTAEAAGIEISEEEVDEQIAVLEEQFGSSDALVAEAERLGLTAEDLRSDIREQILVDTYLRTAVDVETIEVSDEEIATLYETFTAGGQEVPPLEEISGDIKAQLQGQKQQGLLRELIDSLRAEADIEILI